MVDRFDLEQQIMKCWNVTDDIDLLYRTYYNSDTMSKDEVANYLIGIEAIYNARFEELFNTFTALIANKKIT